MKTFAFISLSLFSLSFMKGHAQTDSTGRPGDNLNLYAVLDLFKSSPNVEAFEKSLNDPATRINNLDLNNDGQIDYIRVVDYGKDNFHSLVLQVPVSQTESQDVAVIEVERKNNGTTRVQVVGDEDLYGPNYIVEPQEEQEAQVPSQNLTPATTEVVYVNVSPWPSVAYIYGPSYSYWHSPWYWGYYPTYWHPWRPYGFYAYHQWYYSHPYPYYHRIYNNYIPGAHSYYAPHKTTSVYVQNNITVVKNGGNPQKVQPNGKPGVNTQQGSATKQIAKEKPSPAGGTVNQQAGTQQPMQKSAPSTPAQHQSAPKQNLQSTPAPVQHQQAAMNHPVSKPAVNSAPQQNVSKPVQQARPQAAPRPQRVAQPRMNAAPRNGGGGMNRGGGGGRRR